jgi:hypothetical protein
MFEWIFAHREEYPGDQPALNDYLNRSVHIKKKLLPHSIFTIGMATGWKVWEGHEVEIPKDILVHHANYTVGLQNKIHLLDLVKNEKGKAR